MTRSASLLARWWWRRSHPLVRIGWDVMRGQGSVDATAGIAIVVAGLVLGRAKAGRRKLLYRTTIPVGRSVRVRVLQAGSVVAERTVGS